jgi:choline-sulfatase
MSSTQKPNVLFLLSDEHSFRFLSDHHDPKLAEPCRTPTLDHLKGHGTAMNTTYCQMPLCTPSRMCMLSGKQVRNCGAWFNSSVLAPDLPTIPKTFAAAGYTTALVGKMHFGGNLQYHGFQHRPYGDLTGNCGHQREMVDLKALGIEDATPMQMRTLTAGLTTIPESQLQEQIVARETITFLREQTAANPEKPWFLCASMSRPHFPLNAPKRHLDKYWPTGVTPPKVGRTGDSFDHPMTQGMRKGFEADRIDGDELAKARAAYFACVDYLDEVIGDLLAVLEKDGLLENTIIVYTSDHGEMVGEHGVWWKNSWHEASARVPFIFQTPAQRRGQIKPHQINTPVSLADLFPTLCGLAGINQPDGLDGMDLSTAVTTGQEPQRGYVCSDVLFDRWGKGTSFRMVRDGKYKYIGFADAPELLFDLEADPFEQSNLAPTATGDVATTLQKLRDYRRQSA